MDLKKLSEPFAADDIEWRISRAGIGRRREESPSGVWARALAFITARAIQYRLDEVCEPPNWKNEEPRVIKLFGDRIAFACGISIRIDGEWVTKWDVSEPTQIEPAKGGFSGASKRAGAQWGIGRYLYHLEETYVEVAEQDAGKGWNYGKLPEKQGGGHYWWRPPQLPSWALPKDETVGADELNNLKKAWKAEYAPDVKSQADLRDGFRRFVVSTCGEFPLEDAACWTRDALEKCLAKIGAPQVPFGS